MDGVADMDTHIQRAESVTSDLVRNEDALIASVACDIKMIMAMEMAEEITRYTLELLIKDRKMPGGSFADLHSSMQTLLSDIQHVPKELPRPV